MPEDTNSKAAMPPEKEHTDEDKKDDSNPLPDGDDDNSIANDNSNTSNDDDDAMSKTTAAPDKSDLENYESEGEEETPVNKTIPTKSAFPISSDKSMCGFSLDKDVENVDLFLYRTCRYVIASWLSLIALVYWAAPRESITRLEGTERNAALIELCILTTAVVMRHGPLLWDMKREAGVMPPRISGVLAGGLTVQFIAVFTVVWMVSLPVPIMIDPVFKSRVHLLRWCEWTPLAGFMTLLMQCIDAPTIEEGKWSSQLKMKLLSSSMESFSTFCGLVFPFCPNRLCWYVCMTVSFVTFFYIYYSYAVKAREFKGIVRGRSEDCVELYERSRLSLALHWMCCFTWTIITGKCFLVW
jgi:hypothetical protein